MISPQQGHGKQLDLKNEQILYGSNYYTMNKTIENSLIYQ